LFDIDANGILNVSALEKATALQASITLIGSSSLSKDELASILEKAA